jgi:hypothetical protein
VRLSPARILSLRVVLNHHLGHGMLASAMGSMNPPRFPVFLSVGAGDYGEGLQHDIITMRWNFPTGRSCF